MRARPHVMTERHPRGGWRAWVIDVDGVEVSSNGHTSAFMARVAVRKVLSQRAAFRRRQQGGGQ